MASARDNSDWDVWVSKADLRLQCGMPCSKLEVSTVTRDAFRRRLFAPEPVDGWSLNGLHRNHADRLRKRERSRPGGGELAHARQVASRAGFASWASSCTLLRSRQAA